MRTCNGCTACCKALSVPELDKAQGMPCRYVSGQGCSQYGERPTSCKQFSCLWLMEENFLRNMQRPDKVGVILYAPGADSPFKKETGLDMLIALPVRPNVLEEQAAGDLLSKLGKRVLIALVRSEKERTMIGPGPALKRAERYIKEHGCEKVL